MKGIELPINALIIIAVAVIVLIAIVAMFYPAFSSGSGTVTLETAKSQACRALAEGNSCSTILGLNTIVIYGFDADKSNTNNPGTGTGTSCPTLAAAGPPAVPASQDNLYMLCKCYYQIDVATHPEECRKLCGCGG